ncbi:hypothetical protein [Nocardiopsis quinghaiensis]|uniref:hypothetical protein n=1 Tax=Nocardiopsis quinghaiensis TaxID=464995 RepID=UPI00123BDEDF|nr:hypothetical protein [Nocardiopsis quinghaiensis]
MSDRPRPPALPRPVTGVFVRQVIQTSCSGHFAMVWVDAEPLPEGTAESFAFVDDLPETCRYPEEPLPQEFVDEFAESVRETWQEADDGQPAFAARVVLRDAAWHEVDSGVHGFRVAERLAVREILSCVAEEREPRPVGRGARRDRPVPPMPRTLTSPDGSSPA